ncbi:MAG: tRNA (cytidine(34)-2'-O)-methyltransferase [Deferrisomatales bacterium]|nr:tRNA (cytidine(34)-2'-O)-methyltransferase [Deferrisomatales bacterium]
MSPAPLRLHVILVNPEIPPNTGNVARLCAATGSTLHLVHPLGFSTDDRYLKRAGLDYWEHVEVRHHPGLPEALAASGDGPVFYFSARVGRPYDQAPYARGARLVFGPETRGLPPALLAAHPEACCRIPIWGPVRSINLSAAVGVAVYEAYRQLGAWGRFSPLGG